MLKINFGSAKSLKKLGLIASAIKIVEEKAKATAGEHLVKEMKRTIEDETENWAPLSPATISAKGHDKKLIETSQMIDSIEWRDEGKYITVGVHEDAPNNRHQIALVHEYGAPDAGIPARPFVHPTWEREKIWAMKIYDETLEDEI